jgi:hypothetical protein
MRGLEGVSLMTQLVPMSGRGKRARQGLRGAGPTRQARAAIDDIVDWFDGIKREQVLAVVDFAARSATSCIG